MLKFVAQGTATAKAIMHANVLLAADESGFCGYKNESEIAEIYHVNKQTVHAIRQIVPLVCMDEKPFQLLDEARNPIPIKPGKMERQDGEYVRNGICCIFVYTEPLVGWRHVEASGRRAQVDWANQIQELLEIHYPETLKIRLVMDNLNTHTTASLYEAFPSRIGS